MPEPRHVPALSFHALTGLFDPLLRHALPEDRLREGLIGQADLQPGAAVIEVGCGTGSLLARLRGRGLALTGIEPDAGARRIAARKLGGEVAGDPPLRLLDAPAQRLPLPDSSADLAFLSLVLHHLRPPDRRAALAEIRRVLRPGGWLHVLDFGHAATPAQALAFWPVRLVDGLANTAGFTGDIVGESLHAAGYRRVGLHDRTPTAFGTICRWSGQD